MTVDPAVVEPGGTTGRYLVVFEDEGAQIGAAALTDAAGIGVAHVSDADDAVLTDDMRESDAIVFDRLGVAVVKAAPDQVERLGIAAAETDAISFIEPERIVYALEFAGYGIVPPRAAGGSLSGEYLRGYSEAVANLASAAGSVSAPGTPTATAAAPAVDEARVTWGLQATGAATSMYTGGGVGVAVLDTGFDLNHPDFADRTVTSASFVAGEEVQDANGHGTHCVGTACGPRAPGDPPRYGVATESDIHVGKVLANSGRGQDADILAGIEWAISHGCRVTSMSLGAPTQPGQPHSRAFENAAQRAIANGTLIVAAAGNDSRRDVGMVRPVSHPANCPSIMAVAALDSGLQVASFSNQGSGGTGGQIDIAAPGVAVHSSWPMPLRYKTISGTSMATPHVAGLAALFAESAPNATPNELAGLLMRHARRLSLSCADVGAGLAQAP